MATRRTWQFGMKLRLLTSTPANNALRDLGESPVLSFKLKSPVGSGRTAMEVASCAISLANRFSFWCHEVEK
jgi:hypothetical protein